MFRRALNLARPAALLAIAVLASACVGTAGAAGPSPTPKPDPDRVVFRVDLEGGFVMPGTLLGRLPVVVVHADGRVIVQGPQIEIYPGPLMPSLQVRTLSPDALAALVRLAGEKGLLKDADYGFVGIADAATTVLTVDVDGRVHRVSAYALAEAGTADTAGSMDPAAREGRANLRAFVDALTGIPERDYVDAWTAYEPSAIKVIATAIDQLPDGAGSPVAWPLGDLDTAGSAVGDASLRMRCINVAGADLATALPVLRGASVLTPFTSGGATFSIIVRPLLPGEAGC